MTPPDAGDEQPPALPSGSELARPFLPAKNFDESKRFNEALGFAKLLDAEDVAIFAIGRSSFLLQDHFQKEWAESFMMQLDLPSRFPVSPPRAPAVQPWGLRVAYFTDPAGVLWHVAQRRVGVGHD